MAIQPSCDRCGRELNTFGAILLSPPNEESFVKKFHICVSCYQTILEEMNKSQTENS